MTTLGPVSHERRTRRGATMFASLPGYVPGLVIVCLLAGFFLAWSSGRPTSDAMSLVGRADPILIDGLRADDTQLFAEAHGIYLEALEQQPSNPEALRGAAIADLGLHRFDLALERATAATAVRPDDHIALAAVVDAHIELGNYAAAEVELDRLLSLRPGLESASRLSYLRQLLGDGEGAVQAMWQARAAAAGLVLETARIDALIGELEFALGNDVSAEAAYARATLGDPTRRDAMVGSAAVVFRAGDAATALVMLDSVYVIDANDTGGRILEAEIAASSGDLERASQAADSVAFDALAEHEAGFGIDPSAALPASSWGDPELGLKVAEVMHEARPNNVRVAHAYAWALHQVGRSEEAVAALELATRFGINDAVLAEHADEILAS